MVNRVVAFGREDLQDCTRDSVMKSVFGAGLLKLEPDTPTQQCHLIVFGNECQLIVGYRGCIQILSNNGYDFFNMQAIHKGENIHEVGGSFPSLTHDPDVTKKDNPVIGYYAVVGKAGMRFHEVLSKAQVETVSQKSRARKKGPWMTDYDEMAKKTVLKRLYKRLPCPEIQVVDTVDYDTPPPIQTDSRVVEELKPEVDPFKITNQSVDLSIQAEQAETNEARLAVAENVRATVVAGKISQDQANAILGSMK